jgi:hypothetical protein
LVGGNLLAWFLEYGRNGPTQFSKGHLVWTGEMEVVVS